MSFAEAGSVFSDPLASIFLDEAHSSWDQREIIVGRSTAKRLLLVCFKETGPDKVRIISARRATRGEQHDYEENITG